MTVFLTLGRGGTNLRVGFIELLGPSGRISNGKGSTENGEENVRSRVQRQLEKSWPIGELLKQNKAEDLFKWIGECVAEVVQDGCQAWPGQLASPVPMGVTFSFPMVFVTIPTLKTLLTEAVNIHYLMPHLWVWGKALPWSRILT